MADEPTWAWEPAPEPTRVWEPAPAIPQSFKLRGVGAHGSDVDVVALESYLELHQRYLFAVEACAKWAERVRELESHPRNVAGKAGRDD